MCIRLTRQRTQGATLVAHSVSQSVISIAAWDLDDNGIEVYAETPEDGTWFFDDRARFAARDRSGAMR